MEKVGALERESIMSVLSDGRELANELKRKLLPTSDSRKACDILVQNILSSYENAIKLCELPNLVQATPLSEGSDRNSKDQLHKCKKKKRVFPKWSEGQAKVRSETVFEGQVEDGYNWRKYGQKGILGANHPRAYYRCTHRSTQGCLATKQVQRADNDPSVFEVVYRGKHSCMQERPKLNKENAIVLNKEHKECLETHTTITTDPKPKPENQKVVKKDDHYPSFSFPSTPIEPENLTTYFFSQTNYSPRFLSQATPESYFPISQCPVDDLGNDFGEIISSPTMFTNFSFGDLDFSIDQNDFSSQLLDAVDYI